MTKIKIPDSVKQNTTKCERDFKCLSDDNSCMCEVIEGSKFPSLKIKSKPEPPCPYCFTSNTSHFCVCPTRNAIYKQYNK